MMQFFPNVHLTVTLDCTLFFDRFLGDYQQPSSNNFCLLTTPSRWKWFTTLHKTILPKTRCSNIHGVYWKVWKSNATNKGIGYLPIELLSPPTHGVLAFQKHPFSLPHWYIIIIKWIKYVPVYISNQMSFKET